MKIEEEQQLIKKRGINMEKKNKELLKTGLSLNEKYDLIMQNPVLPTIPTVINTTWEKTGDIYKQFSIYDYSQFTTSTKAGI